MTTNASEASRHRNGDGHTLTPIANPAVAEVREILRNGTAEPAKPARKPRVPRKPAAKPVPAPAKPAGSDRLHAYAYTAVAVTAVLSALCNGYANSLQATIPWAGWAIGLAIPGIILLLAKVAGLLWKRGHRQLALVTGGTGVGLLLLSVWHCAVSISLLTTGETGWGLLLSLPMAVAIDAGLVCCEVAALVD